MIDEFPDLRAEALVKKYPQFSTAGTLLIDAVNVALSQVDENVFGVKADYAVELLACDWLMKSEFGQSLRGDASGDKKTSFYDLYEKLCLQVDVRMFVI